MVNTHGVITVQLKYKIINQTAAPPAIRANTMKNLKNDVELLIKQLKDSAEDRCLETDARNSGCIVIDEDKVYSDTEYIHVEIEVSFQYKWLRDGAGALYIDKVYLTMFIKEVVLITENNEYELTKLFTI